MSDNNNARLVSFFKANGYEAEERLGKKPFVVITSKDNEYKIHINIYEDDKEISIMSKVDSFFEQKTPLSERLKYINHHNITYGRYFKATINKGKDSDDYELFLVTVFMYDDSALEKQVKRLLGILDGERRKLFENLGG